MIKTLKYAGYAGYAGIALLLLISIAAASKSTPMHYKKKNLPAFVPPMSFVPAEGLHSPLLRLIDKKSNQYYCTGFVISDVYAVTAAHCIDKPNQVFRAKDGDGFSKFGIDVVAVAYNKRADYALLQGDFRDFNKLPIESTTLHLTSDTLLMCGFPEGQKTSMCSPFTIKGPYETGFVGFSPILLPGMSGGPVINENGVAIALNTGVFPGEGYKAEELKYVSILIGMIGDFGLD